jgi:hypothetical protein
MQLATEKTASLPMLLLSRRHGKEADYVHSWMRGQKQYVFISSHAGFGHEHLSHGPLFSALEQLDRRSRRMGARQWSLSHLHFTALLMIYATDEALQDRFKTARNCVIEMFPSRRRPGKTYQGFVKAQKRIPRKMVGHLKDHLRARHRQVAGPYWERFGWVPFACDGSRVEVPRTTRNQKCLGCAGREKTGPQLFLTTLYHMGTGLPWDWHIGRGTESERDHLRLMLAKLPPGSLIVADAGFTGYGLMQAMLERGLSFLIRAGSNVSLLEKLDVEWEVGSEGQAVWLWPQNQRRLPPLKLRLIRLPRGCGRQGEMCLLTNVFDSARLSDETAAILYRMRWGVELFYRSYKQTLDQRKLRSKSPRAGRWELHWGMTALLLLGLMSVARIVEQGHDPLSLSVAQALRVIRHAMRQRRRERGWSNLDVRLGQARKDEYRRRSEKAARDWPRKKTETPPGAPIIRCATQKESRCAYKICAAA